MKDCFIKQNFIIGIVTAGILFTTVLVCDLQADQDDLATDSQEAAPQKMIASWRFNEGKGNVTLDGATGKQDALQGHLFFNKGVEGNGLKFDGFSSHVVRKAVDTPKMDKAFTVEAWIAPQEYSWRWTGIVDHMKNESAGYFLGIDHIGLVESAGTGR